MILKFHLQSPAILHLISVDSQLSKLITDIGNHSLTLDNNYYLKLIKSIVGQ